MFVAQYPNLTFLKKNSYLLKELHGGNGIEFTGVPKAFSVAGFCFSAG